ncbi:MAG TPA: hypothetical protein ENK23_08150 [Sorangium sp.]|nr:hypothetical protein [Sorangium sp.]
MTTSPDSEPSGDRDVEATGSHPPAARRRRWALPIALAGVVVSALLWKDGPQERRVTVRVPAAAGAQRVEVSWLDSRGDPLRTLVRNFDGSTTQRTFISGVTTADDRCELVVRVINAAGIEEKRQRLSQAQSEGLTVIAPWRRAASSSPSHR